jgi:RND superfamily putative drug exporter
MRCRLSSTAVTCVTAAHVSSKNNAVDAASAAIREGVIETGRVITAAAAVMVVVFASFILGGERVIELFGLGLAGAVLLDALIIRCLLLPAVLQLLGARTWAFPKALDRRLPRLALEHDGPVPSHAASEPTA